MHFQKEKQKSTHVPPNECQFFIPELQKTTTSCIENQKGGNELAHDNS